MLCKTNIDSTTFNNFSFKETFQSVEIPSTSEWKCHSKLSKLQGKLGFHFRSGQDIYFLFLFCFFHVWSVSKVIAHILLSNIHSPVSSSQILWQ